ncbi:uncharacterized protein A4U43_C05F3880 [Asparagus officinalis]|uniref:DEUBAD domain-containing protein n=1 Tax=Asparagus officinalis TaxID=4686 RepID=A0A5P1ERN9_ASPOF|nr:uncharacterized protein LOC109840969 [Asparagus officinalis]ONK67797.1 uncharacterized protein A4U43_C05F3880 [Asparagus officinalis]
MAIVKSTSGRVSRFDGDDSPEMISADESDDEEEVSDSSDLGMESDPSDADSGMESDEFDLSELGEANSELCQVGNQSFSVPFEIFDLPDLSSVLSLETWNECLTEEERFGLSAFLPDMDQETLARTLTELFSGKNFHFGSPIHDLFSKLKGGMLDPRVVLYRRGLSFFRNREYYHSLRKYQNSMVGGIFKIQDAWRNCSGYGIEERLRLLNIFRSQRSLVFERNGDVGSETDLDNSDEALLDKRLKMTSEPMRFGKENSKGILKVAPTKASMKMEYMGVEDQYPSSGKCDFKKKDKTSKGLLGFPRRGQVDRFDLGGSRKAWNQIRKGEDEAEEEEEDAYEEHSQALNARARLPKSGNRELLKQNARVMEDQFGDVQIKGNVGLPQYSNKSRIPSQGVTIAAYNPHSLETMSNAKYPAKDWMYPVKNRGHQVKDVIPLGRQVKAQESMIKNKKWKPNESDSYVKTVQGNFKAKSAYNGGIAKEYSLVGTMFSQSDETESDSSEKLEEDGELSPYPNKFGYPTGASKRTAYDSKKSGKITKVDISQGNHKSKTADPNYVEDVVLVKKTLAPHPIGKLQKPWHKSYTADKKRKGPVVLDHSSESTYMRDYGRGILDEYAEYPGRTSPCPDGQMVMVTDTLTTGANHYGRPIMPLLGCNSVTKKRKGYADVNNEDETEESSYPQSSPMLLIDESNSIKKKGKKKADAVTVPSVSTPDKMIPEVETADVELKPKPQKKPFTLITPSKHTGFSFSIIHLLSAIRKAMTTTTVEDTADIVNNLDKGDVKLKPRSEENEALQPINNTDLPNSLENLDVNAPESAAHDNIPSFTLQEIVNRVRSNPGDPCILETQEPLQDLVRGVLKIFSSRTAPLGAKAWKALVSYKKSNKSWSWVGPVSSSSSDNDTIEEETSPEAWGLPHKTLVKLVDSFANWLKSGQETLKQIGSLPPPPAAMFLQLDEKERFRDLRAQKSLNTINPSSEEVREYFRKEELLRYLIPDRAFSYTAVDGKKSIVAPLRRGGGKPTSKARDHFMLKTDRPPHVTILCLVRDAAARLPGSIGTRADVCTLIRDSQYIVEEVSDEKVNQVVSGALDRLHYERDPCVRFDSDRKLWVYRHRDREEEDFEDDGTSSTKKWKRPRKDAADQPETGAGNDAICPAIEDTVPDGSGGYDLNPDLNADMSSVLVTESIPVCNDFRANMENIQPYIDPSSGGGGQGDAMSWQPLELNPLGGNTMLCQQNSTNEDYQDETFSRERAVGLLSASLL